MTKTKEEPASWGRPIEFFLTLAAYNVGPGNLLRFPYLCMRNGGAAFLVPYFLCLFVVGIPLFLLEIAMGQSSRKSCIDCWHRFAPILKGVGYSMVLLAAINQFEFQCYYAWILYYLAMSFTWTLPWSHCNNEWNSPTCISTSANHSYESMNYTQTENTSAALNATQPMTAVEEYFQNHVLELSEGLHDFGGLKWQLVIAHLAGWVLLIICLYKGIKTTGKVVWVAATLPYVLITIFLVRAAMLPGFMDGVHLYLRPDFQQLKNTEVWMMGFLQIFYTLGPGWGNVVTVASHNKYNHNFLIECIANPIVCCLTSFYSGFITFGVAGFLSYKSGLPVAEAIKSGPGIAFLSYPELAVHLPGGPIWSALFFIMILNVTLGTLVVMMEACITALVDLFQLKQSSYKYVLFAYAFVNITLGLVFFTRAGMYIFQLIDWYFAILGSFFFTCVECLCIVWLYGYKRFFDDIQSMIGRRPITAILTPLWGVLIPIFLILGMVWSMATLPRPKYGQYLYPEWSAIFGRCLSVSVLMPGFGYVVYRLVVNRGSKKRLMLELQPIHDVPEENGRLREMDI